MTNRAALDAVVDLEQRYPVENWTVGDLHVWPLLRMRLFTMLLFDALGTGRAGAGQRSTRQRLGDALKGLRFNRGAMPNPNHKAVFLSDGVSLERVEGEWYDRIMDPVIDAFAAQGVQSFLMTPGTIEPRHNSSRDIRAGIDAAKAVGTVMARLPPYCQLDGLMDALADITARYPKIPFPGRRWLIEQAGRIEAMAWFYGRLIVRTGARVAFTSNFYGAEGMAFVLAAKRAGCITTDIQHGLQVDHVGYARWTRIPEGGYDLVPDCFWCWSEDDAARINDTIADDAHGAVSVGNAWADMWRSDSPLVKRTAERFARVRDGFGKAQHYLLTPSWGHPDAEFDRLLDAVEIGQDAQWWLRLHPKLADQRETYRQRVMARGIANIEIDAAMDFPLPLLLTGMGVNVTFDSSTVIDALAVGVPSVVTTQSGASIYGEQIEAGTVTFAREPADILTAALKLGLPQ